MPIPTIIYILMLTCVILTTLVMQISFPDLD